MRMKLPNATACSTTLTLRLFYVADAPNTYGAPYDQV
jgi:hypothetical protein